MAENAKTETKVETVTMQDGRLVDFPGKKRLQKESFVSDTGKVSVRMDFRNGETRVFTIADSMLEKFAGHGAEQKLGDEIAGVEDIDDAVLAVDELIARLNAGEWGIKREGGGMGGTSVLLRAIVQVTGKPVEAIKAYLAGKTQAQKMALRDSEKFRDAVAAIEAEKAKGKAKVDISADLAELDSL